MSIREPRPGARGRLAPRRPLRRRGHDPLDVASHTSPLYDRPPTGMPPAPTPRDWRNQIVGLSGLNVIAGIWLIIAPWVLGYSGADPRWNDVVFGIIVGILALTRVTGAYREEWLSWINALIGVWLFIAGFTIDHTGAAIWNDIILGIIVFVLAIGSAEATASLFSRRREGVQP